VKIQKLKNSWTGLLHKGSRLEHKNPSINIQPNSALLSVKSSTTPFSPNQMKEPGLDAGCPIGPETFALREWTFVALSHKLHNISVYLDGPRFTPGFLLTCTRNLLLPLANQGPLYAGSPFVDTPEAWLADVRVFNTALNEKEIRDIALAKRGVPREALKDLGYTFETGSFPGFDLPGMPLKTSNRTVCLKRCNEYDDCAGFHYDTLRSACFLKIAKLGTPKNTESWSVFGTKQTLPWSVVQQAEIKGFDFANSVFSAYSTNACGRLCQASSFCVAFSFLPATKSCRMKSAKGPLKHNAASVTGLLRPGISWQSGEYKGGDLANMPLQHIPSALECAAKCAAESRCNFVTFKKALRQCFLHGSKGAVYQKTPGVVYGTKLPRSIPTTFQVKADTLVAKNSDMLVGRRWTGKYTYTFWFKYTSTKPAVQSLFRKGVFKGQNLDRKPGLWITNGNRLHVRSATAGNWNDGCDPKDPMLVNEWNWVALQHEAGSIKVYVADSRGNFRLDCSRKVGPPLQTTGGLYSGDQGYPPLKGMIADLRSYNRILSEEELREIHAEQAFTNLPLAKPMLSNRQLVV